MSVLSRLFPKRERQAARDRAELSELLQVNRAQMFNLAAKVAAEHRQPSSNFVVCLSAIDDGAPQIIVIDRDEARRRFADFNLAPLDTPPADGSFTFVAGRGTAIEAGELTYV